MFIYIAAFLLIIIICILCIKVKLVVIYKNDEKSCDLYYEFFNFHIKQDVKKKLKINKEKKPEIKGIEALRFIAGNSREILKSISDIIKFEEKKIFCEKFDVELRFSTGDAADTGMLYGAVWGFVGSFFRLIENLFSFGKRPKIYITPLFGEKMFLFEYEGIYTARLYNIIFIILKIMYEFSKYKSKIKDGV